jgi:hypothetical protein
MACREWLQRLTQAPSSESDPSNNCFGTWSIAPLFFCQRPVAGACDT